MKFALPFSHLYQKLASEDVQWIINYKPQIEKLNNFIEQFNNHRIILKISDFSIEKDTEILKILTEKFENSEIVAAVNEYSPEVEKVLNDNNIKHYYNIPVFTWDDLAGFLTLNVTDILITEDLCFSLPIVKEKTKEKGVKIRSYCNVCETRWDTIPSYKFFFIRPDDIDIYAKYIDVFELFEEEDPKRVKTLYEIYHDDKKWFGKLKEIIKNYKDDDEDTALVSIFAEKRVKCNHKCFKDSNCCVCDNLISLNQILNKKQLYVVEQKGENNGGERNGK